jgi:hypothetical protein
MAKIAGKIKAHVSKDDGRFTPYFLLRRMQNEKTNL